MRWDKMRRFCLLSLKMLWWCIWEGGWAALMWVNSRWQTGDFTQGDKPLPHPKEHDYRVTRQDTNPLQMAVTTVSIHYLACVWGRNSSAPLKNVSINMEVGASFLNLFTNWTLLGNRAIKQKSFIYGAYNYCISHALSTFRFPLWCQASSVSMQGVRVHAGELQERSHLTLASHVVARQLIFRSIYCSFSTLWARVCVSEWIKTLSAHPAP